MEGFDTLTMASYLAGPMTLDNVTGGAAAATAAAGAADGTMPLMASDIPDQASNFDAETFVGSEDTFGPASGFQPPTLQRFSTSYDDPFSDSMSHFLEPQPPEHNLAETPAVEGDNKLLSFIGPNYNYNLLDYSGRQVILSMSAQLHGMFFLAESPWAAAGEASAPPTELTCYRRNLFQVTGSMAIPRTLHCILTDQGDRIPIMAFELAISATESVEGNSVKIISVPWKTPAANAVAVEEKGEKEPPTIPLDLLGSPDVDSEYATFPIAWKRLQFRIATANNGRRKELQQHFVVRLRLMATLTSGAKIPICEANSGPIIVRGRSPRNFQTRKDLPLGASGGSSSRRAALAPPPPGPTRTSTGGSNSQNASVEPLKSPDAPPRRPPFKRERSDLQLSPGSLDWTHISTHQTGPLTAVPALTQPRGDSQPGASGGYAQSSPGISRNSQPARTPSAPINLSLTEEDTPSPRKPSTNRPDLRKVARHSHGSPPQSISSKFISSPDESADLLYEYFPLGLDDWMPPVDAVYRPHVVHHTNLPPDPKAQAAKNRSKRYFSEDKAA
ncbi:MAG: hypothetical protein M1837_002607 [Sclerophora amabilis]|nr:MAG: hypothetical protein M1837_002607 [Sclerophora amabilis]